MNLRIRDIMLSNGLEPTNDDIGGSLDDAEWEARFDGTVGPNGGSWASLWHRHPTGYVHDTKSEQHDGWVSTGWSGGWPSEASRFGVGEAPEHMVRTVIVNEVVAAVAIPGLPDEDHVDFFFNCDLETESLYQLIVHGEKHALGPEVDWKPIELILRFADDRHAAKGKVRDWDLHDHRRAQ